MTNESKQNQGPSCACGRGDLYFESLKKEEKAEISDSVSANHPDDGKSSDEDADKQNQ
jgi:hypothetical protein